MPVALPSLLSQISPAYDWLCQARNDWPDQSDVWDLRRSWSTERHRIEQQLANGTYRFSLLTRITTKGGEVAHLWSARDALVLKALSLALARHLPASSRCTHLKGHGGLKGAVRSAAQVMMNHRFVFRTDVRSYYDNIDHGFLIERLKRHIADERVLDPVRQYLNRTSEAGGIFYDFDKGISRGCPLSPVIAAFFLHDLDQRLEEQIQRSGIFYVRYMDDLLVLAPSRWTLRRAVKAINEELSALNLEQHPDKTFIGYIARGFDFLGYRFGLNGLVGLARQTIVNFETKLSRLYEQLRQANRECRQSFVMHITTYINRFCGWATGGLNDEIGLDWKTGGHLPRGIDVVSGWRRRFHR